MREMPKNTRSSCARMFPARLDRADREMGLREMTGGFDVKKVEESTPTKIVALRPGTRLGSVCSFDY